MSLPIVFSLLALALEGQASTANAAAPAPRPYTIAFELGLIDSPRHLTNAGVGAGVFASPEYAGVTIDARVLPHLHLDGQFGLNVVIGWMGSASARLAAELSRVTISVGAGPLVASGTGDTANTTDRPPAVYASADLSAILHFDGPFVLLFRAGAAVALDDRGGPMCGIDTCTRYLARGDHILFSRLGVGSSF